MARAKQTPQTQAETSTETKGARTRMLILETVAELLAEKGQRFVLDEVCARTGLTVGAFYFHFKNKEEAIEEVVIHRLRRVHGDALEAIGHGCLFESIYAIIWLRVTSVEQDRQLFHLPYRVIPTSERVYTEWLSVRDAVVERLASTVAREKRGANARASSADYLSSQFLMAGLEGFMENAFYGAHAQMTKIDLRPVPLSRDLAAIWYSAVMGREPSDEVARSAADRVADRQRKGVAR